MRFQFGLSRAPHQQAHHISRASALTNALGSRAPLSYLLILFFVLFFLFPAVLSLFYFILYTYEYYPNEWQTAVFTFSLNMHHPHRLYKHTTSDSTACPKQISAANVLPLVLQTHVPYTVAHFFSIAICVM